MTAWVYFKTVTPKDPVIIKRFAIPCLKGHLLFEWTFSPPPHNIEKNTVIFLLNLNNAMDLFTGF
jgi:hypothetical protein